MTTKIDLTKRDWIHNILKELDLMDPKDEDTTNVFRQWLDDLSEDTVNSLFVDLMNLDWLFDDTKRCVQNFGHQIDSLRYLSNEFVLHMDLTKYKEVEGILQTYGYENPFSIV